MFHINCPFVMLTSDTPCTGSRNFRLILPPFGVSFCGGSSISSPLRALIAAYCSGSRIHRLSLTHPFGIGVAMFAVDSVMCEKQIVLKRQIFHFQHDFDLASRVPIVMLVIDQYCKAAIGKGSEARNIRRLAAPADVGIIQRVFRAAAFKATSCDPILAYIRNRFRMALSMPCVEKARVPSKQRSPTNRNAQLSSFTSH